MNKGAYDSGLGAVDQGQNRWKGAGSNEKTLGSREHNKRQKGAGSKIISVTNTKKKPINYIDIRTNFSKIGALRA